MDQERAADELKVLRQLMERPIRFSTMSGLSGILAGAAALAGCAIEWAVCSRLGPIQQVRASAAVWAGVFVAALAAAVVLTRLREKKQGMPFWSPVKRRILVAILPAFLAMVGLSCAVAGRWYCLGDDQWRMLPVIWMLIYGLTLWSIGEFAPGEVRVLGAAFLAAAVVCGGVLQWSPYLEMGITFGGFHILYGIAVWVRHGG